MKPEEIQYEAVIEPVPDHGGAYVRFPYDLKKEFGKGRLKVHAWFDGVRYDGSIVNMGIRNADGSICYIIGIRKDIRKQIGKEPGDTVTVRIIPAR
ncbi:MAG: DUF1905 domain-containing protein [Bulleidia sp.]